MRALIQQIYSIYSQRLRVFMAWSNAMAKHMNSCLRERKRDHIMNSMNHIEKHMCTVTSCYKSTFLRIFDWYVLNFFHFSAVLSLCVSRVFKLQFVICAWVKFFRVYELNHDEWFYRSLQGEGFLLVFLFNLFWVKVENCTGQWFFG